MGKTLKKGLAVFLVVLILLTSAPLQGFVGIEWPDIDWMNLSAKAVTEELPCGEATVWTFDDASGTLTISGNGPINDFYNGSYPGWYNYCGQIRAIVIEEGVTSIGNYSFAGYNQLFNNKYYTELTAISLPSTLTNIGERAFSGCINVTDIELPENLVSIGKEAFSKSSSGFTWQTINYSLVELHIPSSVVSLGENFCSCPVFVAENNSTFVSDENGVLYTKDMRELIICRNNKLTEFVCPDTVTTIHDYAFYKQTSLTDITLSQTIKTIGSYAFYGCSSISALYLPNGLETIKSYAFYGCTSLKSLSLPEGTKTVGKYAFYNCSALTTLTIPSTVEEIPEYAFYSCDVLKSVNLTSGIKNINSYAFGYCESIVNITLPDTLENLAGDAFYGCTALATINISSNNENFSCDSYGVVYNKDKTVLISYPKGRTNTSFTIPSTVTEIAAHAFYGATKLSSIAIPSTVSVIGEYAFYGCDTLKSITIPASVKRIEKYTFNSCDYLSSIYFASGSQLEYIGNYAFANCNFTSISLPSKLKTIDSDAFYYCDALKTISIPASVEKIGSYAFEYCYALNTVTFASGSTLKDIGNYAFYDCDVLTSITIPSNIETIGSDAFDDCDKLKTVTFASGSVLKSIGSYAFDDCVALTSITIPSSVEKIGSYAFRNCDALKTVTFSSVSILKNVDNYAFYDCDTLTSVAVPASVETIGSYAFCSCDVLKTVTFGSGSILKNIGSYAFSACGALTSVTIPASVETVGTYAFNNCDALKTASFASDSILKNTGSYVFYDCDALTSITIPDSIETIGSYAFYSCDSLANLTFSEKGKLKEIASSAFQSCVKISSVDFYEGITKVGNYAFKGCHLITSVNIPASLTSIGIEAFECPLNFDENNSAFSEDEYGVIFNADKTTLISCLPSLGLTEYIIPDTVTKIESGAFQNCDTLLEITIPESLKTINSSSFSGCSSLQKVKVADIEAWCNINFYNGTSNPCYYSADLYADTEKITKIIVSENITEIKPYTFYGCASIKEVLLHDNITSIGKYAFYKCANLEKVDISQTSRLKTIETYAFVDCSSLEEFYITEEIEITENYHNIFSGCSSLARFVVSEMNTHLSSDEYGLIYNKDKTTLYYCPVGVASENINLPDSLKYIAGKAFYANVSAKTVIIPDNVINMGTYVFAESNINSVRLSANLDSIPEYAFYCCDSLESVEIPYGIEKIGKYAFRSAVSLKDVSMPNSINSIDTYAFSGCTSLKMVTLSESLKSLTSYVFSNCAALEKVYFGDNSKITSISSYTFENHSTALTFYGASGSYIQTYANNNSIAFKTHDHNYISEYFAPTEMTEGYTLYKCTLCSNSYIIYDPAVPVENLVALPGTYSISLSWSKAVEASVTGYKIYRKTKNTDYSLLKTITSRNTLSYVDSGLSAGVEYIYKIMAVKGSIEGAFSVEVSAVAQKDLEAPTITSFTPAHLSKLNKTITLAGNATDNLGYVKYCLSYAINGSAEKIELVQTDYKVSGNGFSINFSTNNLQDGTYDFYLSAIDKEGNESNIIKRTYLIDNTGPVKVTGLSAVSVYASSATIRWDADENEETFYYKLQQKNGEDYIDVASQISTLGYNLKDLNPSTTYTYRVAGMDELGNIGEWSDEYELTTKQDTSPPVIVSQSPKSADFSTEITYSVTASDDAALQKVVIQVSRDGNIWEDVYTQSLTSAAKRSTISYTLPLSKYEDGLIYMRAVAYDTSGLSSLELAAPHSEYNVDKTAPEKINDITALGGNGYIEIKWKNIEDAAGYYVYRSTSISGSYTKIATAKALNYIDTSVAENKMYYYKVVSYDVAGNMSEASDVVSATMNPDTEAPYIKQINLSSNRNNLTIVACDNRQVNSITAEYKVGENGAYTTIAGTYSGSGSTKTLTVSLPYSSFAHDSVIYIRAKTTDGVGLSSEYSKELSFRVDKVAPTIDNLVATVNNDNISVSFTGSNEEDVSLYYISYSKNGSQWQRYASVSPNATKNYCFTKSFKNQGNGSYSFRVEAVDTTGNTNYYFTQSIVFAVVNTGISNTNVLSANFIAPSYMEATVSEYFDASLCTSVNGISEYFWDFGDGTTSNILKPSKAFSSEGTYTVSLTVFDAFGNSSTCKKSIVVSKRDKLGTVKVTVKDDSGNLMKNMPVYFDLGENNQSTFLTDNNGTITRNLSEGNHVIGACKAPDYLPVKKNVVVVGGATTEVTLVTVNQTIYDAEITVNKMTLSEIIAAGVDVEDPANNNYYYATIEFRYGEYIYKGNYIRNDNTIIDIKWPSIKPIYPSGGDNNDGDENTGGNSTGKPNVTPPTVVYIPNEKGLELLAMISAPTTISYLKDFYNVRFTLINNASSDFTIINNEITIQVPNGLSLVSGLNGYEDTATVIIDELYGGTSRSVDWCLRGDSAGTYNISVTANGILDEFNIPLSVTATNSEPITVLSMADTIKLRIETPDSLFVRLKEDDEVVLKRKDLAGHVDLGDYKATSYFNVGVTNISDNSIYMPEIELGDVASQLKSHGVYIEGETELKHEATFLETPDGTRVKTSDVTTLDSGCTLINYYSLNFSNASGLTDEVLLAPLTSIVVAAANDKDVKIGTKVQSTLFEEHYYGKVFNSHVHTYKESVNGKNVEYTCPCGYSYRVVVSDEETSLYDPAGAAILKELGFDIETILSNVTFSNGKVVGPSINVLGKDFSLFELDTSFKLPILSSSSVSVDTETQTIKIMIGAKDSGSATIQQPEKADSYWKDSYAQLKTTFQKIEGDKASTKDLYNDFRKLRKGMKGLESKGFSGQAAGFNFDCNLAGYIEFSYNKDSFTYVDGGLVAGVNLGASYTFRPPVLSFIYVKLGVTGGLSDSLNVSYKNEKLEFSNTLTASLGANAHLGIGDSSVIKTYVEGYINGGISAGFTLPAKTLEECLLLKFTASGGITTEVFGHEVKALSTGEIQFVDYTLYPKNQKRYSLRSGTAGVTEQGSGFENSQVEIIPRNYSVSEKALIDGVSFQKEDLYQYPNPSIVSYGKDNKLLLWIDDNGSKSDINRTSVFASIYSDGQWSDPIVAVESEGFCEGIKVVSNGENVYIVYSTTPSALSDSTTIEDAIKTSEIYFTIFDGNVFSEPIRITENSLYELGYVVGANKSGKASIAWIENNENNFVMSSGTTSINMITVDGNDISEPVNIAAGDEITAIGMSEDGESVYWADITTADLYCFTNNEREIIYDASENVKNINISDGSVWFVADEKLYCYADSKCTEISSSVPGDINIVSDGTKTTLLTKGSDEERGYVFATELTEDKELYFTPIFSDDDCYIREISATYSSEGNLIIAINTVEITEEGKGDSSLYVLDSSSYCDISVGDFSVEFDVSENMCTAEYYVANNSANVVDAISVEIKNGDGELVLNSEIREPILPGEVKKFFSNFECHEEIDKQQFTITITSHDTDVCMDDNSAVYVFDAIDISLVNIEFEIVDGIAYINGELDNNGYTDATNLDIILKDKITGEEILRDKFDSLSVDKNQLFSFELPGKYYSSVDDAIKLELIVDAKEFESSYENNFLEISYTSFEDIAGNIECINHVFDLIDSEDPTCIKAGTYLYECKYCGYVKAENIPINENNHGEYIIKDKIESTCVDFGYSGDTCCSLCGKVLEVGTVISKKEHKWNEGVITHKPNCVENGVLTFTCKSCDETYYDSVAPTGHIEMIVVGKPATCSSVGLTDGKKCSVCGEVLVEQTEIAKLTHSYKSVVITPTCTTSGYTIYTCSVCKYTYKANETAKLGHSMGSFIVVEQSTCTENGIEIAECSRCDYSKTNELSATGHNYEDGVCTSCGDSKSDNCSCNCHKSGFMGFIWKILRFFYKLFKTNKVCGCGVAHY